MTTPLWAWIATLVAIGVLLGIDLALHRRDRPRGLGIAAIESALWIAVSIIFGVILAATQDRHTATQYFVGYLLEKSLSVDNIFTFALLFRSFAIPLQHQRKVLYWGVISALILRGAFVAAGAAFADNVSWSFYLFGTIVLIAGVRMALGNTEIDVKNGLMIRSLRRFIPLSTTSAGKFFVHENKRRKATPLLFALLAIEITDLIFATDSIPAVFGVTTNVYIVFTSNAFAVLGLRSLYFVLAEAIERFTYLSKGLAVLLVFMGAKMLLQSVVHISTNINLLVIVAVLGITALISLRQSNQHKQQTPPGED